MILSAQSSFQSGSMLTTILDANEALAAAEGWFGNGTVPPDLVLPDLSMPLLCGFQLLAVLKGRDIPVAVFTASLLQGFGHTCGRQRGVF